MSSEKIRILEDKKRQLKKIKDGSEKSKNNWEERKVGYEKDFTITNNVFHKFEAHKEIKICKVEI
ncbi:MAG: hypothetical protein QNJ74_07590 [Trichodesmium sp. MO_231.B1]|nr:hypothetical protein [Trichodesmium sp. MO_231.B1]